MSRKQVVETVKALQHGLFACKPTIQEAFAYADALAKSLGTDAATVHTAVHVVCNTIAKELLKLSEVAPSVNDRQIIMIELMDILEEQFDCYEEGLTTDLECTRKMYLNIAMAFQKLDVCTGCGAANEGNHFETYGGNLCPECNTDKRVYTVSYGVGFPVTAPVLKYHHQLAHFEDMDMGDEALIDNLNPSEMTDIYLSDNKRIHVMRTR